jgi:hypothetical protein
METYEKTWNQERGIQSLLIGKQGDFWSKWTSSRRDNDKVAKWNCLVWK